MFTSTNNTLLSNTRDFDSHFNPIGVDEKLALTVEPNAYFKIKSNDIEDKIDEWNSQMLYSKRPRLRNDSASKSKLKISQKIREIVNNIPEFDTILQTTFSEISFLLDKDNINYQINVDVEEDKEFPEWKETVVSIKIANVNQEDIFQIWETIENQIQSRINGMGNETIKKEYENLILIVNHFE